MKILLVNDHFDIGGVTTVTKNLSAGFCALGHKTYLLGTHKGTYAGNQAEEETVYSVDCSRSGRLLILPQIFKIRKIVHMIAPDLIITNKDHVGFLFAIMKLFGWIDAPIIHNPQTTVSLVYKNSKRPLQKLMMRLCRRLFARLEHIVNSSRNAAEDTADFYKTGKVPVIYNAIVRQNDFYLDRPNPFLHKNGINVVACGRLAVEKNYPLMLRAFAVAKRENADLYLTILGDGKEKGSLENLAEQLSLQSSVTWGGRTENVQDYMFHADMFWMTSLYEGLPTVMVEALSQGCPVLSVDCPYGPAEILENGRYGCLVESYDVDINARALLDALSRKRCDREFYRARAKDFDITKAARNYLELLEK